MLSSASERKQKYRGEPKLRIVQLVTVGAPIGGSQTHIRDLAIGLRKLGHECIVMAGPPEGIFFSQLRDHDIPARLIPSLTRFVRPVSDSLAFCELVSALRRYKPDIVAAHTAKAGLLGRLAAALLQIPCVFTPHGWSITDRKTGQVRRSFIVLERIGAHFGRRIISVCNDERRIAEVNRILSPKQITVIHNGIPDNGLLGDPGREPVNFVTIARFDQQKDHVTLLNAFVQLRKHGWRLRLIGDGPLRTSTEKLADRLDLTDRIEFLGERRDISRILSDCQVFVLASNFEAFPISILEAMRAGLPVVTSNVGGISEAVQDGITGFLVPPSNPNRLAERLKLIIENANLRRTLGANGRKRYLEDFTAEQMVNKTLTVYEEVLLERRAQKEQNETSTRLSKSVSMP